MNKADAVAWFDEVIAKDPGAHVATTRSSGRLAWTDSSIWDASARTFVLAAEQAIKRTFPSHDPVVRRWDQVFKEEAGASAITAVGNVYAGAALLREARSILTSGRFETLIDGVRADTVAELLDQADALVGQGWLAAAMVTAGGAVEIAIRHMCERANPVISVEGHGSIEKYNSALSKRRNEGTELLTASQSKMITTWGGLRNDAAHDPITFATAQTKATVKNAIDAIRMFLGTVGA